MRFYSAFQGLHALRHVPEPAKTRFFPVFPSESIHENLLHPLVKETSGEHATLTGWMRIFANETSLHPNRDPKIARGLDYDPRNMMTRYVTCHTRLVSTPDQSPWPVHRWYVPLSAMPGYKYAINAMRNISMFGITELYPESLCVVLDYVYGADHALPDFCD